LSDGDDGVAAEAAASYSGGHGMESPATVIRALYAAIESGAHGDALRAHFTDDAVTVEHPNLIRPSGGSAELKQMLEASSQGAGLLIKQRYALHSALEHGSLAIVRLTWTGELARDAGPLRKGQVLTAHIAQFVETRKGRVARIETYDCYEQFSLAADAPAAR
jgi:ketosteroid isomerase-like protein